MQFSLRFKQLCKEHGVTQKKAFEDMGMHRNSAQRWIDGTPQAETLIKIAEYFGITTDEVLGVDNKKTPTPEGERKYTVEEIMGALDGADDSVREAVLLLLKLK